MDPNEALKRIRKLVEGAVGPSAYNEEQLAELAELFDGLDAWLSKGGFLPKDWNENR